MRRARLIVSGQPHDRVFVYLQGEFAGVVNNTDNTEGTAILRDAYADIFLTENKEWRIRAGQSKIPFDSKRCSQAKIGWRSTAMTQRLVQSRMIAIWESISTVRRP